MSSTPCKQIYDLTLEDLSQYPIWECLSEDDENAEDECTMRAYSGTFESLESMCIVQTNFTLRDGTVYKGFINPAYHSCNTEASIFFPKGTVSFWFGVREPSDNEIADLYKTMDKQRDQVFPILWESLVPISGRFYDKNMRPTGPLIPQAGTIEGFGCIKPSINRIIYIK